MSPLARNVIHQIRSEKNSENSMNTSLLLSKYSSKNQLQKSESTLKNSEFLENITENYENEKFNEGQFDNKTKSLSNNNLKFDLELKNELDEAISKIFKKYISEKDKNQQFQKRRRVLSEEKSGKFTKNDFKLRFF